MGIDYNVLSTNELQDKYKELTNIFTENQQVLKESYFNMVKSSEEAIRVKKIIEKRGGKV